MQHNATTLFATQQPWCRSAATSHHSPALPLPHRAVSNTPPSHSAHPPTELLQVAATVTGAGRQWAVYDESYGDWNFTGTDALPKGSLIFAWWAVLAGCLLPGWRH